MKAPPNSSPKWKARKAGQPAGRLAGRAEAERGRQGAGLKRAWGGQGGPGRGGARTRKRLAGSREVDKAAAAFYVSGELILNRYKMAEGDEAARRQQAHQDLRCRRRTSDPSSGVNHVSSTTFLGAGQRGGGRGGAAARATRTRGHQPQAAGSSSAPGFAPLSCRRVRPPGLDPAAPLAPAAAAAWNGGSRVAALAAVG